ncbi:unnamed protein product [Sphagnum compactum]
MWEAHTRHDTDWLNVQVTAVVSKSALISETPAQNWLKDQQQINKTHLQDLLKDKECCEGMIQEYNRVLVYFSCQYVTHETLEKLLALAKASHLQLSGHFGWASVIGSTAGYNEKAE